ncbi:MAG: M20 family metallopeptidase [Bacteroidota bacterium]
MKELINKIKAMSSDYLNEIIEIRRHIHTNPELGFEEYKTSEYIATKLTEFGIPFKTGIAKTGIVALIECKNPEKITIALRADMDALPILEQNQIEYKSVNEGVMHACGHDAHVACLLGAAKIINTLKEELQGTAKLIFQPSEEMFPGGALAMINEGVLENPKPDLIIGQHVLPTMDCGKMGLKAGKYMASTDEIYLTVKGKGGHGATPELNIDPVVIAAHIIIALQQIVSRNARPDVPTVLSFGRVIANGRTNIIPDIVTLDGTLRTFDESWRAEAHLKITKMAQSIAEGMGGSCDVRIEKGYPFLVNDDMVTKEVSESAKAFLGEENVEELPLRMTAEDFAYFTQQIPACFYRLGIRNESKGITSNLHTNTFNIDEDSLKTGMGLMAWLAVSKMK